MRLRRAMMAYCRGHCQQAFHFSGEPRQGLAGASAEHSILQVRLPRPAPPPMNLAKAVDGDPALSNGSHCIREGRSVAELRDEPGREAGGREQLNDQRSNASRAAASTPSQLNKCAPSFARWSTPALA